MIVGVLTTCHTQYTWDSSICISYLTFLRRNYFFIFLAHPVNKMWIIQGPNTQTKSDAHSEGCVCVCRHNYPACNAHASYYFVICGLSGCTIFSPHFLINGTIFGKKRLLNTKRVFISVFNQLLHIIFFTISFISWIYLFRAHVLIIRRSKLYYTASSIVTPIGVAILEAV